MGVWGRCSSFTGGGMHIVLLMGDLIVIFSGLMYQHTYGTSTHMTLSYFVFSVLYFRVQAGKMCGQLCIRQRNRKEVWCVCVRKRFNRFGNDISYCTKMTYLQFKENVLLVEIV